MRPRFPMRGVPIVLIAVGLLLSPGVASSQAPSLGPRVDEDWALEERTLQSRVSFTDLSLTSSRNSTLAADEWDLAFDARQASLFLAANGSRPDGPTSATLGLRIRSLIEFQDQDGDGRLGLGDPIVQQMLLTDGQSGWVESVTRPDGQVEPHVRYWAQGANLEVVFRPTAHGTVTGGGSPTAVPLEVRVLSFPYLTDNRTHLALELRIDSPVAVSGNGLATPDGALRTFLAWAPGTAADGNETPLGVTLQRYLGGATPQWLLALSQPRESADAVHLAVGVARVAPGETLPDILKQISGDWRFYVLGVLVAAAVVGWPLYRRLRGPEVPR